MCHFVRDSWTNSLWIHIFIDNNITIFSGSAFSRPKRKVDAFVTASKVEAVDDKKDEKPAVDEEKSEEEAGAEEKPVDDEEEEK